MFRKRTLLYLSQLILPVIIYFGIRFCWGVIQAIIEMDSEMPDRTLSGLRITMSQLSFMLLYWVKNLSKSYSIKIEFSNKFWFRSAISILIPSIITFILWLLFLQVTPSNGIRIAQLLNRITRSPSAFVYYGNIFNQVVTTPLFEEMFFRQYLFRLHKKLAFKPSVYIVTSSLVFALLHIDFYLIIFAFIISSFAWFYRLRYGSVFYSVLAHSAMNLSSIIFLNIVF